ncbi:entry exclusion lipoprotein TrbK [Pseudomonas sp. KB-10]|uniref:entry exclusion lipoprotein TrbK n=1 Tax=Pseudomonas sp. KB-10 TaxID=2292264 RepID=UPI001BAEB6B1|nr:entry exclusion lipoprotein TrbK [Pseudomonas sp. KB-10]
MTAIAQSVAILMAVFTLSACDKGNTDYEVNDKNCSTEHYQKLPEGSKRDALVEGCMSR